MSTWTARLGQPGERGLLKMALVRDAVAARYAEVIEAWRHEPEFRFWFNDLLASAPFRAFRWETRSVSSATVNEPFECVLVESLELVQAPDQAAFDEHFRGGRETEVVAFPNLGGDAILVVPRPVGAESAYGHLGAFVREAPEEQRAALWRAVGDAMARRLGPKPVWLSTAGAGVAWLHVRLDDRPKYYAFTPYRTAA